MIITDVLFIIIARIIPIPTDMLMVTTTIRITAKEATTVRRISIIILRTIAIESIAKHPRLVLHRLSTGNMLLLLVKEFPHPM
jgi:hypothetical protein